MMIDRTATEFEINFVRRLGLHVDYRGRRLPQNAPLPRKELLERYKAGCLKRARWDNIDRGAVLLTIDNLLKRC
jgi:hypothetical protein